MPSRDLVEFVAEAMHNAAHRFLPNAIEWKDVTDTPLGDSGRVSARAAIAETLEALAVEAESQGYSKTYEGEKGPFAMTYSLDLMYTALPKSDTLANWLRAQAKEITQ